MNNFKSILTFLTGAGAGIAAGILMAPRSGKKTRAKISNDFNEKKNELEELAGQKLDDAKSYLNKTVEKQTENGKDVLDRVRDTATF